MAEWAFGFFRTVVAMAVAALPVGQAAPPATPREPLLFAEAFLKATFPELSGDAVYFEIAAFGSWGRSPWRFDLLRVAAKSQADIKIEGPETYGRALLVAELSLVGADRVRSLAISGRLVRTTENDAFASLVREHREWKESDVHNQLRLRGARFVSSADEVVKLLPLPAWKPLFGELKLLDSNLDTPAAGSDRLQTGQDFLTRWELLFENRAQRQRYLIRVEPFEGRLTLFSMVAPDFTLR